MSKNENLKAVGTGSVMPAGTLPIVDLGGAEELTATINHVSDQDGMNMVKVEYPDGFEKNHQADTVQELIGKIQGQFKGRYGVLGFEIEAIPEALKAGEVFKLKGVVYDT